MKHNILLFMSAILLSITVFSCSQEDIVNDNQQINQTVLKLQVTAENFPSVKGAATRTVEDGYTTLFTDGDKLGLLIKKGSGDEVTYENREYTYQNGQWTGKAIMHSFGGNTSYIAYYPYNENITDETSLNQYIANFTPNADQSTYDSYTASDLMKGDGTASADPAQLTVALTHQMAMVELELPKGKLTTTPDGDLRYHSASYGAPKEVVWEGDAKPYSVDGRYFRYLVKPGNSVGITGGYSAYSGKSYFTVTAETTAEDIGKYTTYPIDENKEAFGGIRKLQIGDYLMNDRTIYAGDAANAPEGCIGIVFQTDPNRMAEDEKTAGWNHGYVLALTDYPNEGTQVHWGKPNTDEEILSNIGNHQAAYNDLSGYASCKKIRENMAETLSTEYVAFYSAQQYGVSEATTAYAAPDGTSGWYLPSVGQWWDILENLNKLDLSRMREDVTKSTSLWKIKYDSSKDVFANLNTHLKDEWQLSGSKMYWTSTEATSEYAYTIGYDGKRNYLRAGATSKERSKNGDIQVRCVLAF